MNYKLKLLLAFCFSLLANQLVFSQKGESTPLSNLIDKEASTERWIQPNEPIKTSPVEFLNLYGSELGLKESDNFRFIRKMPSTGGDAVYHSYQQYHKNVKVEAATLVFHIYEDAIRAINGDIVKDLQIDVSNVISEPEAEAAALNSLGMAEILVFENGEGENIKTPKIELLIVPIDYTKPLIVSNYVVVYRVPVQISNFNYKIIDIDAHTSQIIRIKDDRNGVCYPGTVITPYNGTQTLVTTQTWEPFWIHYRLINECNGYKLETMHDANSTPPFAKWKDGDNAWTESGATAHWIMQKSWDYFNNTHGLLGPDGNGFWVQAVHVPFDSDFPFASSSSGNIPRIFFEDARSSWTIGGSYAVTTNSPLAIDIIAHEYTHLVIGLSGNLSNTNGTEAQSLNEGFCDIFGNFVQSTVSGVPTNAMWKTGEDMSANSVIVRLMATPNISGFHRVVSGGNIILGMPDVYQQTNYWDVDGDGHANMGVLIGFTCWQMAERIERVQLFRLLV